MDFTQNTQQTWKINISKGNQVPHIKRRNWNFIKRKCIHITHGTVTMIMFFFSRSTFYIEIGVRFTCLFYKKNPKVNTNWEIIHEFVIRAHGAQSETHTYLVEYFTCKKSAI